MLKKKCIQCGKEWNCSGKTSLSNCNFSTVCRCLECFALYLRVKKDDILRTNKNCFPEVKTWRIA